MCFKVTMSVSSDVPSTVPSLVDSRWSISLPTYSGVEEFASTIVTVMTLHLGPLPKALSLK